MDITDIKQLGARHAATLAEAREAAARRTGPTSNELFDQQFPAIWKRLLSVGPVLRGIQRRGLFPKLETNNHEDGINIWLPAMIPFRDRRKSSPIGVGENQPLRSGR